MRRSCRLSTALRKAADGDDDLGARFSATRHVDTIALHFINTRVHASRRRPIRAALRPTGLFLTTNLNSDQPADAAPTLGLAKDELPFRRTDGKVRALRHIRHFNKYLVTGST